MAQFHLAKKFNSRDIIIINPNILNQIFSMLSVGLVGLPNAGKSSLFNLITENSVPAANFPFCTIDPTDGMVAVKDERLDTLAKLANAQKTIYATIEFKDIAGLVKGASQGAGLGNQFLSHIRECDMILMVLRCFQDDNIIHVENRVNPEEDEEILMMELTMADQTLLEKLMTRLEKDLKTSKDVLADQKLNLAQSLLQAVSNLQPASNVINPANSDKDLIKWRKGLNLLSDKPIMRLGNISLDLENMQYPVDFELDVAGELTLVGMSPEERVELGASPESGLDKMIKQCFHTLKLATYLTVGEKEARAWTFTRGMSAPECAGKIHTDFEKKFIKANLAKYGDFMELGGWKGVTAGGKLQIVGKDYTMLDGDIVEFMIGA